MYASDWNFVTMHGRSAQFLDIYSDTYACHFGFENTEKFMGGNALAFLGFDDPGNKNAQRLVTRYRKYKAALPPWLSHDDRIV